MYQAKIRPDQNDQTMFELYDITKNGQELTSDDYGEFERRGIRRMIVPIALFKDDFIMDGTITFNIDDVYV